MPDRRLFVSFLALALVACAAPPAEAVGSLVDLQIVDRARAQPLPVYRHRGAAYVAGDPGARYAVRLVNRSAARVLVVLSVDGVNAVSGETASVGQSGYVLAPYGSAEITGWRKSYAEAAAFYFTSLPDSYAARTDRPDNVGVIGVAVFRERTVEPSLRGYAPPPVARDRAAESDSFGDAKAQASPAPGSNAVGEAQRLDRREAAKSERLGTGHGEREYSPTTETTFERESSRPSEIVQVRYDSRANLLAMGVIDRPRPIVRAPDAFPGFVPDPR